LGYGRINYGHFKPFECPKGKN